MSEEWDEEEVEEEEWQEEEWGEDEYVDEEYGEYEERGEGGLRQVAASSKVSDNHRWGSPRCVCGSGLPSHYCYECHARVCSTCHTRHVKLPRSLSFPEYVRVRRHLKDVLPDPDHAIMVRMSGARRRLMETYGIDPDRDNAEEAYATATSKSFADWLVENRLTNSYDNALKYVLEKKIVVKGFSSEEVAKAIHHCSRRVYWGPAPGPEPIVGQGARGVLAAAPPDKSGLPRSGVERCRGYSW